MRSTNNVLKNISSLAIENVARLIVGFVLSVLLARLMSVEDYGRYNYLISFSLVFLPFFSFSSDDILIKKIVYSKNSLEEWFPTGNSLRLLSGVAGFSLGMLSFYFIGRDPVENLPYIGIFLFFYLFKCLDSYKLFYQASSTEGSLVKLRLIVFFLLVCAKLYVVYKAGGWKFLIVVSALEVPLFAFVQFLRFRVDFKKRIKVFGKSLTHLKGLFKESFPLFLVAFLSFVLMKVDQLMIPKFLGYQELSYYSVAAKLVDLWSFVPGILVISLYPKILNSSKMEKVSRHRELYSMVLYSAIALSLLIYIGGPFVVKILYGQRYLGSSEVIGAYSFTLIFNFFNLARQKVFVSDGNQLLSVQVSALALVLNVLLNLYLIPLFGVVGAIYATLVAQLFSNIFISFFSQAVRASLLDAIYSLTFPKRYFKI